MGTKLKTRQDFLDVQAAIGEELAKPVAKQDQDFLERAIGTVNENEDTWGKRTQGTSAEMIQQGALANIRLPPELAQLQNVPEGINSGPGMPPLDARAIGLGAQGLYQGAKQGVQGMGDFVAKAWRGPDQEAQVAAGREADAARVSVTQEEAARRLGVSAGVPKVGRAVGREIPAALLGAAAGAPQSRLLRVGAEGVAGAIAGGGANPSDPNAAVIGTGIGLGSGALAAAMEVPGGARDWVMGNARRAARSPETAMAQYESRRAGMETTLAEDSQSPSVGRMEASASAEPGGSRATYYAERRIKNRNVFLDSIDKLNPEKLSTAEVVAGTKAAYNNAKRDLQVGASANLRANLKPAVEATGGKILEDGSIEGGARVIPAKNFAAQFRRYAARADEPAPPIDAEQAKALIAVADDLEKRNLSIGELQQKLAQVSDEAFGKEGVYKGMDPRATRKALMADLDTAADKGEGLTAAGASTLRNARTAYAKDIEALNQIETQAVDKLLGTVGDPAAQDFGEKVLALPAEQFTALADGLEKVSPGSANTLRGAVFSELVDRHSFQVPGAPEGTYTMDYGKFLASIDSMPLSQFRAFTGADLPNATLAKIRAGVSTLRRILAGPEGQTTGRNAVSQVQDTFMNIASRNAPFMLRFASSQAAPGFFERWLFTPEKLKRLALLGESKPARGAVNATMAAMLGDLAASEKDQEDARNKQIDAATVQYQRIGQSAGPF